MRQKFRSETVEINDDQLKSISELDKQVKNMSDVTGKLIRGFKDLIKLPKTVNSAFNDIEKIVYNSTSKYADDINRLNKANLDAIRVHGINSQAIKNQTASLLSSVQTLKDFKESAKDLNFLLEKRDKLASEIKSDPEKAKAYEAALKVIDGDIKKMSDEMSKNLVDVNLNTQNMTEEMQEAMADYTKKLSDIIAELKESDLDKRKPIEIENISKILVGKMSQVNTTEQATEYLKKYLSEAESQIKGFISAATAMITSVGKGINTALLSRLGTNLAENNFITAVRMGLSPTELNSVARTSTTELGLASGSFNAGDVMSQSGLMVQMQDSARKIGLIGAEGTKAALETFNFQLRSGQYNPEASEKERISSTDTFLQAVKLGAAKIHAMPDEYLNEMKDLMDSGYLIPIMDQLDRMPGLKGDQYVSALLENVAATKANIRNLGLNSSYLKMGLELQRKAGSAGFEEYLRGKIGTSISASALSSFTGMKLSESDKELLQRYQDVKNINLIEDENDRKRIMEILRSPGKIRDNILVRRGRGEDVSSDMARMTLTNTLMSILPSDAINETNIQMAREAERLSKEVDESKKIDGTTPLVNQTEKALSSIIEPLNLFETALLDAEQKIRGAMENPFWSALSSPVAGIGSVLLEGASTAASVALLSKMGLLGGGDGKILTTGGMGGTPRGGRGLNFLKGSGKLALYGGAAYGAYSLLTSNLGGSGNVDSITERGILDSNGEIANASFTIKSGILNIGNAQQQIGSVSVESIPPINTVSEQKDNFSDDIIKNTSLAAIGVSGFTLLSPSGPIGEFAKKFAGKTIAPLTGIIDSMQTYNELGEEKNVGRSERVMGSLGSGVGSAGGWLVGAAAGAKLGALIGGSTANPLVVGGLSIAGGIGGAYLGEEAVQEAGQKVGKAFDYIIDYTADSFFKFDKFVEKFGIGVSEYQSNLPIVERIDQKGYNDNSLNETLVNKEQKLMENESEKEKSKQNNTIDPSVREFMNNINNFVESLKNFIPSFMNRLILNDNEQRANRQIDAAFSARAEAAIGGANQKAMDSAARAAKRTSSALT